MRKCRQCQEPITGQLTLCIECLAEKEDAFYAKKLADRKAEHDEWVESGGPAREQAELRKIKKIFGSLLKQIKPRSQK